MPGVCNNLFDQYTRVIEYLFITPVIQLKLIITLYASLILKYMSIGLLMFFNSVDYDIIALKAIHFNSSEMTTQIIIFLVKPFTHTIAFRGLSWTQKQPKDTMSLWKSKCRVIQNYVHPKPLKFQFFSKEVCFELRIHLSNIWLKFLRGYKKCKILWFGLFLFFIWFY